MMMTREQAEERAQEFAALDTEHEYTKVAGFKPHNWVIEAIIAVSAEAFDEGHQDGWNNGHSEGYQEGYDDGHAEGYEAGQADAE